MERDKNPVGWFEIPVTDMDRAIKFYEAVFECEIKLNPINGLEMAWFPMFPTGMGAAGALVKHEQYTPSADGPLIYFSAFSGDVDNELRRAEEAGGKILMPKKQIGEKYGHMGIILDTEGNRIAVHAR